MRRRLIGCHTQHTALAALEHVVGRVEAQITGLGDVDLCTVVIDYRAYTASVSGAYGTQQ